jgi:hypothetical protein
MDFDKLQKAWQSQKNNAGVDVNIETLLKQVQEKHRKFVRAIFWRDVREVAASVLGAVFLCWLGLGKFAGAKLSVILQSQSGWPCYVAAGLMLGVGLFFVVNRFLQRRKERTFEDTVKNGIERTLHQVNHEIWLIKNVFWWYYLPGIVAIALVFDHVIAIMCSQGHRLYAGTMIVVGSTIGLCFVTLSLCYFLNRRYLKNDLIPRRDELAAIARELNQEE